jgi:creatinine amidohydrolase/Fe(II)-dependent formamide hydrolase-like protein
MNMKKAVKNLPKKKKFHMMDPYADADRVSIPSTLEAFRKATAPSGVTGDPTLATKAKGEYLHKEMIKNLVELIKMARKEKVSLKKVTPVF